MDKFIRSNPLPSARKIKQFDWIIGKSFCPCHLCLFLFFSAFILRIFSMKTLIHWPFDVSIFSWHVFTNISNQKCIKSLERKEKHFHFTLFDSIAMDSNGWNGACVCVYPNQGCSYVKLGRKSNQISQKITSKSLHLNESANKKL